MDEDFRYDNDVEDTDLILGCSDEIIIEFGHWLGLLDKKMVFPILQEKPGTIRELLEDVKNAVIEILYVMNFNGHVDIKSFDNNVATFAVNGVTGTIELESAGEIFIRDESGNTHGCKYDEDSRTLETFTRKITNPETGVIYYERVGAGQLLYVLTDGEYTLRIFTPDNDQLELEDDDIMETLFQTRLTSDTKIEDIYFQLGFQNIDLLDHLRITIMKNVRDLGLNLLNVDKYVNQTEQEILLEGSNVIKFQVIENDTRVMLSPDEMTAENESIKVFLDRGNFSLNGNVFDSNLPLDLMFLKLRMVEENLFQPALDRRNDFEYKLLARLRVKGSK